MIALPVQHGQAQDLPLRLAFIEHNDVAVAGIALRR
jgi:hypothetical protein